MRIVAILQARLGSTRLPNKIMLPMAGRTMLDNIYERVKRASKVDAVTVAIPRGDYNTLHFGEDATYIPFNDWFLSDGDENDLVGRYLAAATRDQADLIVRVPCDNPCVDPAYIDWAIESYLNVPSVFVSNADRARVPHPNGWTVSVDGVGAEVFSMSRLKWLDEKTRTMAMRYREHPHLLFHETQCVHRPDLAEPATIRLDVNTRAEYEFVNDIYAQFGHNRFSAAEAVAYLTTKEVSHAISR